MLIKLVKNYLFIYWRIDYKKYNNYKAYKCKAFFQIKYKKKKKLNSIDLKEKIIDGDS